MKPCLVCSLSAVIAVAVQLRFARADGCEQSCPNEYNPVCGSDGTIYSSLCELKNFQCWDYTLTPVDPSICGLSKVADDSNPHNNDTPASAPSNCDQTCSFEFVPVCGSDGSIYLNECMLQNAQCRDNQLFLVNPSLCGLAGSPVIDPWTPAPSVEPTPIPDDASVGPDCQLSCPKLYIPLCGTDGVTYSNTCFFELARCQGAAIDFAYDGECHRPTQPPQPSDAGEPCIKLCAPDNHPVCGTNGITYLSACLLENAMCTDATLSLAKDASCDDQWAVNGTNDETLCQTDCTTEYLPVCGSDGVTYANECVLQTAHCLNNQLQLANQGPCSIADSNASSNQHDQATGSNTDSTSEADPTSSCQYDCTMDYWPICGSDGVTYNNACVFQTAQCENKQLALAHEGECKTQTTEFDCGSWSCTPDYSPVCGSDGTTFPNLCMFRMVQCVNSALQLTYAGPCSSQNNNQNGGDYCQLQCEQQFDPVCGTDGRTYMSSCELLKAKCLDGTIEKAYEGVCAQ